MSDSSTARTSAGRQRSHAHTHFCPCTYWLCPNSLPTAVQTMATVATPWICSSKKTNKQEHLTKIIYESTVFRMQRLLGDF